MTQKEALKSIIGEKFPYDIESSHFVSMLANGIPFFQKIYTEKKSKTQEEYAYFCLFCRYIVLYFAKESKAILRYPDVIERKKRCLQASGLAKIKKISVHRKWLNKAINYKDQKMNDLIINFVSSQKDMRYTELIVLNIGIQNSLGNILKLNTVTGITLKEEIEYNKTITENILKIKNHCKDLVKDIFGAETEFDILHHFLVKKAKDNGEIEESEKDLMDPVENV